MTIEAYAKYTREDWVQARIEYAAIRKIFPTDIVAQRMLEKCENAINKAFIKRNG